MTAKVKSLHRCAGESGTKHSSPALSPLSADICFQEPVQKSAGAEEDRLVRLPAIIGPKGWIPVCRSSFYQGIRDGLYPQPVKLGRRVSAWRLSEILKVVRGGRGL